jgi:glycosyltransferase involved in cell wall biosynthesis
MNVGIVTTWFERGAAYVSRQYLKAIQSDSQNNVFVYARSGELYGIGQSQWDKSFVTWGKKNKKYYTGDIGLVQKKDFIKWIEKCHIEVILFNEQNWWMPVLWCKELGVKTGTYVDYYNEETVPFFAIYDYIFCNTLRHYSLFNEIPQCYYVPWGTEIDVFNVKYRSDKNYVTFFHSAGMNPVRKGTDIAIKAFLSLPSNTKSKLIIHTQSNLDLYFKDLNKIIYNNPNIDIITKTVSAPGLYHLGDVYVYPSILDGLGLTVVEALSCGLPCIVSNHAPMNEFIKDGENGKLVEIEYLYARKDGYFWPQCKVSINSVANQMLYYIRNIDKIKSFQRDARESVVRNYNWADRYIDVCSILRNAEIKPYDRKLAEKINHYEYKLNGKYNKIPYLCYYYKKYFG